jgi:hypothetical protein
MRPSEAGKLLREWGYMAERNGAHPAVLKFVRENHEMLDMSHLALQMELTKEEVRLLLMVMRMQKEEVNTWIFKNRAEGRKLCDMLYRLKAFSK